MMNPVYGTADRDRSEITQEMIDAGVRSYLDWDHLEDDPQEIVAEIFRVMAASSPRALQPNVELCL